MKIRIPWLTLALTVLVIALPHIPGAVTRLEFSRIAPPDEIWRWVSAHFVHCNASHLAWDTAALLVLGTWVENISRRGFAITIVISALVISTAVWWCHPALITYRGLSGVDSALFGFVLTQLWATARREHDQPLGIVTAIAGILFLAKSAYELNSGQTLFAESIGSFVPVPLAHLVGLLSGGVAWALARRNERFDVNPTIALHPTKPKGSLTKSAGPTCPTAG